MPMMKAAVFVAPGRIELADKPIPPSLVFNNRHVGPVCKSARP